MKIKNKERKLKGNLRQRFRKRYINIIMLKQIDRQNRKEKGVYKKKIQTQRKIQKKRERLFSLIFYITSIILTVL